MQDKILILLTGGYPFGSTEPYLHDELEVLSAKFKKIFLFSFSTENDRRPVPENVVIYKINGAFGDHFPSHFSVLFSKYFWADLLRIIGSLKPVYWVQCLKILTRFLQQSKQVAKLVEAKMQEELDLASTDIVFYSYWADEKALAGIELRKKYKNIKAVSRAHRWEVYEEFQQVPYLPLRKALSKHLNAIYFVSEQGYMHWAKAYGADKKNMRIARLGVNENKPGFSEQLENSFTIVSCSNVIPVKRVGLILESIQQLDFKVHWIHFGAGTLFDELKGKAATVNKSHVTITLMGHTPNEDVIEYYRNNHVDVLVNVSESEGIPVSMMEAMSFGIPVIGTNVGGVSEIIKNKANGLLLSPHLTAAGLKLSIEQIHKLDRKAYNEMRNAAYNTWSLSYNSVKNYTAFFESISSL